MYATDRLLDDDDLLEKALTHLRDERLARRCAEQELAEARPKLAYYDQVLAATGAVAISRIAKDYGMSARQLTRFLPNSVSSSSSPGSGCSTPSMPSRATPNPKPEPQAPDTSGCTPSGPERPPLHLRPTQARARSAAPD